MAHHTRRKAKKVRKKLERTRRREVTRAVKKNLKKK